MGARWTTQQQQVIDTRNCNLLVSAAAGSGKTAVLVERIIHMITDPEHPLDIDRLLIMTFTNAAAAEMRERIGAAIDQRLWCEPENEHLQMQATLVHHAQITTIDSFCLELIRTHFDRLELDPAFRIGDDGELKLLREDVLAELLEAHYEEGEVDFEAFVETFAQGKGDYGIGELLLKVYQFSQSNPWPQEWLDTCLRELEIGSEAEFEQLPWVNFMTRDIKSQLGELIYQLTDAITICEQDEILSVYLPMLDHDRQQLLMVQAADSYEVMQQSLRAVTWDRLAVIRKKDIDLEAKAYVTACRDRVKKAVSKMIDSYAIGSAAQVLADLEGTKQSVRTLIRLTGEFSELYQQKKRNSNLVDFNDLEHQALQVLWEVCGEKDGIRLRLPTAAADELSGQYEEILVDEYQDSNLVQEALIGAISRERFGNPNIFMVGDVKQSIYKFRLAKPELFLEKYDSYQSKEGLYQKIELHQNFRSRAQVLECINEVFYRIMTANLGNIHYTEAVALHPGTEFAEPEETDKGAAGGAVELLLLDTGKEARGQLDDETADYTSRELEARLIAARIRELLDPEHGQLVWDKQIGSGGGYRRASYRDISILLRSTAEWAETFLTVFMNEDIPAYAESKMGYFDTREIQTMLSVLAVIDNPLQDIPLTAVLKSPVGGLRDDELARLVAVYKRVPEPKPERGVYGVWRYALTKEGQEALRGLYREEEQEIWSGLQRDEDQEIWRDLQRDRYQKHLRDMQMDDVQEVLGDLHQRGGQEALRGLYQEEKQETLRGLYWEEVLETRGGLHRDKVQEARGGLLQDNKQETRGDLHQGRDVVHRGVRSEVETEAGNKADALLEKLIRLDRQISRLRLESAYLPIHELLYRVFQVTGFYDYVSAMPAGAVRQANLDMLVEKAAAYEKTSYKGLFHFIRYIEKLKKINTDFGEAAAIGEDDDTVRIISIHKSKGLEFPIVFLSGMGKQFNKRDVYSKLLIDPDLGIGTDYLDLEHRLKVPTLKKNVLKRRMEMDTLGEELRVLYVGMTRAKEKLIMTGTDRSLEKKREKFARLPLVEGQVPYTILATAGSYLDWVLMSGAAQLDIREIGALQLVGAEVLRQVRSKSSKNELMHFNPEPCRHEGVRDMLRKMEEYRYPWQAEVSLHTKISVSELKKQEQLVDEEETASYFPLHEDKGDLPLRYQQPEPQEKVKREFRPLAERETAGVIKGNAYHQFLRLLDFTAVRQSEDIAAALAELAGRKRLLPESVRQIRPATVWGLVHSTLGQRMMQAQLEERLYRERQFIFGIPAAEITKGERYSEETKELVVIQGIIDAYFEEADGLVLVDYKTDRILPGQEELLMKRYGVQLEYYQKALEQITGKTVKQTIIYSLSLQSEITVFHQNQ